MQPKNILLCGFYNKKNFGDDIMHQEITKLFSEYNIVLSDETSAQLDLFDYIFIGGGGLIDNNFWLFKHLDRLKSKKSVFINVNLTSDSSKDNLLNKLLELNTLWIVRDKYSFDLLQTYQSSRVFYSKDISIPYFKQLNRKKEKQLAIVCNYYLFKDYFSENIYNRIKIESIYWSFVHLCNWMMHFGWKIVLVPAQTGKDVDDRVTNAILHGMLKNKSKWIVDENEILEELSKSKFIISSRYHFSVFAIATNSLLLDIVHHDKNKNLIKDVGCLDLYNYMNFNEAMVTENMVKNIINMENSSYEDCYTSYINNVEEDWQSIKKEVNRFYE